MLAGEQARQIATVLRLEPGTHIVLVADQIEHEVVLQSVSTGQVTGKVVARRPVTTELRYALTIALPLLRGDHSEEVLEAVVQLGATRLVPFVSARSVARELTPAKRERWARVAREAAETARRGVVPAIDELASWPALFGRLEGEALVCWEEAREPHLLSRLPSGDVSLVVGPEGGLSADEVELARSCGASIVSLGARTLRAETAAIAAVAMLVGVRDGRS